MVYYMLLMVIFQYRFMRTRINREKAFNREEQAPSAELIFMGLRFVTMKVLNSYVLFYIMENYLWQERYMQ